MEVFTSHCPHCRSIEFRAVGWRNALEKAVRWIVMPYRCELCGHHFFLFRWQHQFIGAA
jgi:hypothetical protein